MKLLFVLAMSLVSIISVVTTTDNKATAPSQKASVDMERYYQQYENVHSEYGLESLACFICQTVEEGNYDAKVLDLRDQLWEAYEAEDINSMTTNIDALLKVPAIKKAYHAQIEQDNKMLERYGWWDAWEK